MNSAEDEYRGPATVCAGDSEIDVEVVLRGYFQPIDGRFHWYGRVAANPRLDKLASGKRVRVLLRTPDGEAEGSVSEPDPWQRYRITGTGRPPFPLPGWEAAVASTE
jgi:hypothetical protein